MSIRYHDRTKHSFHRFAPALGYLDWASQPNPFRRFAGARLVPLAQRPLAADLPYEQLYSAPASPRALTAATLAELFRCSLGLSAWKAYGSSRWALRVNPSSGNLHPTEAYVVTGLPDVIEGADGIGIFHYAPKEHALEERCRVARVAWPADWSESVLVGLTSIHWREAWKYGERAFRYCQHDVGHAIAAIRFAASLGGWRCALLPRWSDEQVASLLGLAASAGDSDPEREAPDCLMVVGRSDVAAVIDADPALLLAAIEGSEWRGTPNRLSPSRVEWPAIEEVAEETAFPGITDRRDAEAQRNSKDDSSLRLPASAVRGGAAARDVILRRRSAVAFDGRGTLSKAAFAAMLQRLVPGAPPWDAVWWPAHVHLVLFVHRVDGVIPGIYAFLRDAAARASLAAACRSDCLWEPVSGIDGLFLLAPLDCRDIARRLSCDQDIAADGFFGLAMLARVEDGLREYGPWFYRNLFWECGMIGQVLYLDAEAAGARATGIGCFYDDPTHDLLGLAGHAWQSLYHFSAGIPVDDTRLTTEPGYAWET